MEGLYSILPTSAIVTEELDPAAYKDLTACWAAQLNLRPRAVVAPPDVESLAKVVQYLYGRTELDFAFRGHGYCPQPAKDVLVSMHRLDEFTYDPHEQTITVGAGQTWRSVYEMVDKVAPNHTGECRKLAS
jgi:FAD/FMN-containing dehydrogenase